jgi:hypothetical protein
MKMEKEANEKCPDVRIAEVACRRVLGKIEFSVTVANQGNDPCFVVARLCRLELDSNTRMLSVWFASIPPATDSRIRRQFTVPETYAIPPNASKILNATVAEDMTRIVPHENGTFHLEALNLTQVGSVEIHVAVDDKPIYFSPERKDHRGQMQAWGRELVIRGPIGADDKMER